MDPYKILGIDKDASADEIRRAYRQKAAKYHPDVGGDAWIFQQIQDAYDELTGKKRKKKQKQTQQNSNSSQKPQTKTPDPFTDDPFANDSFGFETPNPPERGHSHWQTHAPKSPRKKSKVKKIGWIVGTTAAVTIIVFLGAIFWWNSGNRASDSSVADNSRSDQLTDNSNIASPRQSASTSGNGSTNPVRDTSPPIEIESPPESSQIASLDSVEEKIAEDSISPPPKSADPISTLPPHPVLLLTFDEDDEANGKIWDSYAEDFVGVNKGASYAEGKVGKALRFSGKGYAEAYTKLPENDSPRTLAAWIKSDESNSGDYILRYGGMFALLQNSQWRFIDWNGGLDSNTNVDSEWHHHCMVYNGNEKLEYYLDGKLAGTVNRKLTTTLGMLFLGTFDPKHERPFSGLIDELVVYDEAISELQVQSLFSIGNESQNVVFETDDTTRSIKSPSILIGHYDQVNAIAISPDGTLLVSAASDSVRMWNLETGKTIWSSDLLSGGVVPALIFDSAGRTVWACGTTKTAQFDANSGKLIKSFDFGTGGAAAFTPDCKTILMQHGGQLRAYSLTSGEMIAMQRFTWTTYLSISSDSKFVLVGGFEDSETKMVSMASSEVVRVFPKEKARSMAVFSNGNNRIALWTGPHKTEDSVRHKVRIFDGQSGRLTQELLGFGGWQCGVAFSPDDRLLATVGGSTLEDWGALNPNQDKAVRIWDVASGRLVQQFDGHNGCAYVAAFTPDGRKLATGGIDCLIRIWDLDPDQNEVENAVPEIVRNLVGKTFNIAFGRAIVYEMELNEDGTWNAKAGFLKRPDLPTTRISGRWETRGTTIIAFENSRAGEKDLRHKSGKRLGETDIYNIFSIHGEKTIVEHYYANEKANEGEVSNVQSTSRRK